MNDVTVVYDNGIRAVNKASLRVDEGEFVFLVGASGSGKSTLMRGLLGLKTPSTGTITFNDLKPTEIGYLPQQTIVQRDFPASVREIVQSGCINRCGLRPFYNKAEKKLAADMMKKLEISDLANRCYRELSGGQQQRVLLARALCAAKKMILLDEPVTGLDPKASAEMYELIESLNKKDGMTVIMVSHDMNAAVKYASHILHLGGKQLFFGTKNDYMNSKIGRAFISAMGGEEYV